MGREAIWSHAGNLVCESLYPGSVKGKGDATIPFTMFVGAAKISALLTEKSDPATSACVPE